MDSSISEFGHIHCDKSGSQLEIENILANSADPDEMANYDLDLHCLQKYHYWSVGIKRVISVESSSLLHYWLYLCYLLPVTFHG